MYKQPIEELATKVEELNEARGEKVCDSGYCFNTISLLVRVGICRCFIN